MFKRFFQKRNPDKLSKFDYWKKWELFELFNDLHKAERILGDIENYKSDDKFLKFKNDFTEELYEVKGDNVADFTRIWEWFAPTKEWDIFGQKEEELGKNIFRITDKWKRNRDFVKGTKVLSNGEFGVVLDKTTDNEMYGQIRWDTSEENDIEDWRGLFGSFLQTGGKIINQEHQFKYINDDGTTKKASR
ncbi:hypothetical protein [Flavobacterium sp. HJJ]|uniref:hypothetical protein n=1 Tax=Flavobacterium sp. HJJ TaxID=2783792 RepID=UPI00188C0839|nr:hypothetical protein [Flavobacterium sp. HJJ]MBF4471083.1 hypothetical protein [Flavobacterium sp. HJJ]